MRKQLAVALLMSLATTASPTWADDADWVLVPSPQHLAHPRLLYIDRHSVSKWPPNVTAWFREVWKVPLETDSVTGLPVVEERAYAQINCSTRKVTITDYQRYGPSGRLLSSRDTGSREEATPAVTSAMDRFTDVICSSWSDPYDATRPHA
jgi:hypothetical protein